MIVMDMTALVSALWICGRAQGWQPLVLSCRALCSRDKEQGRREPDPSIAGFVFFSTAFETEAFRSEYIPEISLSTDTIFFYLGCFSCCFQNTPFHSVGQRSSLWYMRSLPVLFPLYFFLIVPSTRPVANPRQPRAHPGAGRESSTTANTRALTIVVEQQGCCKSRTAM